jgi:cytochrome c biogenesis protein CcmG/thiol:disulfide interchange protein DsbE
MRRLVIPISILLLLASFSTVPTFAGANEEKPTNPLHQAAADGDISQVKSLISRGADVNAKDELGQTPLQIAKSRGHADVVELLHRHEAKEPTSAGTPDRISSLRPVPRDSRGRTESLVIAKAAPSFTLRDLNGKQTSLSDFRGKVVILDFWATWYRPCVKEIPHFIALYEQYRNQGFVMVGISVDHEGVDTVKSFVQQHRVNYPILMADGGVKEAYGGITAIPTTFVIDKAGKIQRKYIGYRDKPVFEADIKTLLADAQIGRPQPTATTYATSTTEPDPIADPNAVKARIKTFEGLEKALTQVDRRSRFEVREWLQTRVDNRIKLAKAVEMQVKIEVSFIRKVAVEEKAKKTTKEIDDLLLGRRERLKTLVKTMEEETRRMRFPQRGSREIGGQRRSRPSAEERRRAWEERRSGGRLTREDTREQGGFGGTGVESPAVAPETAPAGVGGKNEIQASEWLKTGVENRISLAKAVQEPVKAVLIYIRKFAVEEGTKKTTAAIDGLLLSRQKRMERLVQRMEEQLKRLRRTEQGSRRIRGPRRSILNPEQRRSGGLTPTEGTGGQEAPVEEENRRRRR